MGLISFLNPVNVIKSTGTIIKDFSNYIFYCRQIKKMEKQGLFTEVKGRLDWINRLYYAINLEPETLLATGDIIDLERSRVYESVSKIQGRFADHNLVEIIKVTTKRIKDDTYYAYIVFIKYDMHSKIIDLGRIIAWSFILYFSMHYFTYVINHFAEIQQAIINTVTTK